MTADGQGDRLTEDGLRAAIAELAAFYESRPVWPAVVRLCSDGIVRDVAIHNELRAVLAAHPEETTTEADT